MILLPRGNPLKENVDPGRVNLPAALEKLRAGDFTGYLRFDTRRGTGVLIFDAGRLISALFQSEKEHLIAYDAIAAIFDHSLAGGAKLDIYRLSNELAMSIHALLHGEVLYRGQELRLIDIKSLLGRMKEEQMSGCLRIYTDEHIALIFYRNGTPLGFFHDGSTDIEKNADTSLSVAKMPGAKVDLLTTGDLEGQTMADLMESADLGALWAKAREVTLRKRQKLEEENLRGLEQQEKHRRQEILRLFREKASMHLGKIGGSLVEKEFEKNVPEQGPVSETALEGFYQKLSVAAKLVAGPSTIKTMVEEMKQGLNDIV